MSRALVLLALVAAGCSSWEPYAGDSPCAELLTCPAPVSAACTAPQTPVEVPDAASCELADVSDDRLETYPLGETVVSFGAEATGVAGTRFADACTTTVEVFDDVAPIVVCEDSVSLARAAPDAPWPDAPAGDARDTCSEVSVTVTPAVLSQRLTDVETVATDSSGNVGRCTTSVEVLDLFAVEQVRVLSAVAGESTTAITLGWDVAAPSDVDSLDVQFAESPDGPWQTLESVSALRSLAEVDIDTHGYLRVLSRSAEASLAGGASEAVEVHPVGADGYQLEEVSIPGIPFRTTLYGVVRYPAELDAGPYPLVVLLHGNHGNCRRNGTTDDYCATLTTHDCDYDGYSAAPNAEGMAFQAETLAAQGMIAVSISGNAVNCRSVYIRERAHLIRGHVSQWATWNAGDGSEQGRRFAGKVDLSRIGLVGHSRGGDAVSLAPSVFAESPVEGATIASVYAIAPTDYLDTTMQDAPYAVLLPACDGDVSNLWGSDIYERSDGLPHKAQIFFAGANHNYFSTEWTYDDGQRACPRSARVGLDAQTRMLEASLGSWLTRTLADQRPEAWQRGEVRTPPSLRAHHGRELDLRWTYTHAGAEVVEDMLDVVRNNRGDNNLTGFTRAEPCSGSGCGSSFLQDTPAVSLAWGAESRPSAECRFTDNADTSAFDAISFRIVSLKSGNDGVSEQAYAVVVTDESGQTARLQAEDLVPVPVGYSAFNVREVMQSVRVPFSRIEAENVDIDTSRIASVRIELGTDGSAGAVAVTDVSLGE